MDFLRKQMHELKFPLVWSNVVLQSMHELFAEANMHTFLCMYLNVHTERNAEQEICEIQYKHRVIVYSVYVEYFSDAWQDILYIHFCFVPCTRIYDINGILE